MNKNKFYYISNPKPGTKCKICNSNYLKKINALIAKENANIYIIKKVLKLKPPLKISNRNLALHKKNHLIKTKLKPKIKQKRNTENTKGKKQNGKGKTSLSDEEVKSLNDFLDLIIQEVNKNILSGNLKPTVAEGVKAAEIKAKIKEESKYEKDLLKLFLDVSTNQDKK